MNFLANWDGCGTVFNYDLSLKSWTQGCPTSTNGTQIKNFTLQENTMMTPTVCNTTPLPKWWDCRKSSTTQTVWRRSARGEVIEAKELQYCFLLRFLFTSLSTEMSLPIIRCHGTKVEYLVENWAGSFAVIENWAGSDPVVIIRAKNCNMLVFECSVSWQRRLITFPSWA